jgi:hypothetical protein
MRRSEPAFMGNARVSGSPRDSSAAAKTAAPTTSRTGGSGRTEKTSSAVFLEALRTIGTLRQKSGIAGIGSIVGFSICIYACHAGWTRESLPESLLCVSAFTLTMILLQRLEEWWKGPVKAGIAPDISDR